MLPKLRFNEAKHNIKSKIQRFNNSSGICDSDTFNVESSYLSWLHEIYKRYLQDSQIIVNLEYHKIQYWDKEQTFKEWIALMISMCEYAKYTEYECLEDEFWQVMDDIHELHGKLLRYMWW